MIKYFQYNQRAFFYATIIVLGLIFLMNIEVANPSFYLLSSFILYLVVVFEMFYVWFVSKEKLKQLDLPLISDYTKLKQMLHHFILPSLMYVAIVGFIYFNNQISVRIPLLVLSFFAFLGLFINLRAFYQDKAALQEKTYVVYDLIELIIFFAAFNILFHVATLYSIDKSFLVFTAYLISLILFTLNLYQWDSINLSSAMWVVVASLVPAIVVFSLIYITNLYSYSNGLTISFLSFLSYYIVFGITSHKLDGSLKIGVVIEYISILILAVAFLLGIS